MLGPNLDSLYEERVLPGCDSDVGISPLAGDGFGNRQALPVRGRGSSADGKPKSAFFLVDFEIQYDVLAAVEAGDGTGWGFVTLFFRM